MSRIGLPFVLVFAGYGPLAVGHFDADPWVFLRLVLLFALGLLAARLGISLEENRTAAQLAGLYCVASPLAAYLVVTGAPVAPLAWACVALAVWTWLPGAWRRRRAVMPVSGVVLLLGSGASAFLSGPAQAGAWRLSRVATDFLLYGAWLVMPAPLATRTSGIPAPALLLGLAVWGFWFLMAVHRAMMGKMLPRNTLFWSLVCLLPLLGRDAAPGLMPLPLVFFAVFLMGFLRPSKLIDSPRILLLAAFFLFILARSTAEILSA